MKLSKKASEISANIYQAIIAHPFNQELMNGVLSRDKFAYYIDQDILYLRGLVNCYNIIAAKATPKYAREFLKYADDAVSYEQEMVHNFFKQAFESKKPSSINSATFDYNNYLLNNCKNEPLEVGMASLLPCFTVYQQVGLAIARNSLADNPYAKWIEAYSSKEFSDSVEQAVNIFDEVADNTDEVTRQKMLDAYTKSCHFEYKFLDGIYYCNNQLPTPNQEVQKPAANKFASLQSRL